jgi:hypothetical protein
MGAAGWNGKDLKEVGERHGWLDRRPGANHPFVMKKTGMRSVPIRSKIQNPNEARSILKQMEIPRDDWPQNLK